MGALTEPLRMADALAKGAGAVAPQGLQARAFRAARDAMLLCEVVCGQWKPEDALVLEGAVEAIDGQTAEITQAEFDAATCERSLLNDDFLRIRAGKREFIVQTECDADVSGDRYVAITTYVLRLEGWR